MDIEHWKIDPSLKQELDSHYKTKYSLSLSNRHPMDIAKALTFDGLANSVTTEELTKFLKDLNVKFLNNGIKGVGLEIGSGPGTFVATLAMMPHVTRVYGIEACEAIVEKLMTKVVTHITDGDTDNIVGAVADFNHLELPDASVDFVFDFFSLHHSTTPEITLKELSRVLKSGGVLFCIDKARADSMSKSELESLLDIEYTAKIKLEMGIDPDILHTRRMNGENEYRLKDWKRYFEGAGFIGFTHYNMAKIGGSFPSRMIKHVFSTLPVWVQSRLSKYISKRITNNLEPSNRIFTNIFPSYPREFSLFFAQKK